MIAFSNVKKITKLGKSRVINLSVEKNHTFVTENGIVTHNCELLSMQAINSIKALQEQFSKEALFIFTTNHPNKLPDAILSRFNHIRFVTKKDETKDVVGKMFARACQILDLEGIEYNKTDVAKLIKQTFPDMRATLKRLQKASIAGTLDSSILINESSYSDLIAIIKDKKWLDMRKWVAENGYNFDFTSFYDDLSKDVEPSCLPAIVLHISEYDYRAAFVADKDINITAFLTQVMKEI